jgi:hypothetical protein
MGHCTPFDPVGNEIENRIQNWRIQRMGDVEKGTKKGETSFASKQKTVLIIQHIHEQLPAQREWHEHCHAIEQAASLSSMIWVVLQAGLWFSLHYS